MAAGDLVSVTVIATGWEADVTLSGLAVAGTYVFGLGTNNDPATGTPKITFTVVSLAYDNTGAATTATRTVYGTKEVRWPATTASIAGVFTSGTFIDGETVTASVSGRTAVVLGGQSAGAKLYVRTVSGATNAADVWTGGTSSAVFTASATHSVLTDGTPRERNDGTNTTVRVALSEYVYQKDATGGGNSGTAPVVNVLSGFYTSGGTPNAASGAGYAVTNSSTIAHQKVVGNWSYPPNQRVTGNFTLCAVAFHNSAKNGAPVAAVKFTVTDQHSHTVTTTVTAPSIEGSYGDAAPIVEFIGTINVSTLDALDTLTCNFIAYPWVGDSGALLDTSAGTAQPTPLYGPVTMLNDKSSTFGVTCARVATDGNDAGANTVYDVGSFNEATAYKFLTIGKALAAIAAYNNTNHSRNNCGGGVVVCEDGTYAWTGTTNTYGSGSTTWARVGRTAASTSRDSVIISGTSIGNAYGPGFVMFDDIKVVGATLGFGYGGAAFTDTFWARNCNVVMTNASTVWDSLFYVTGGVAGDQGGGSGFGPYTTTILTTFPIVRGVDLSGFDNRILAFTVIGNKTTTTPSGPGILFNWKVWDAQSAPQAVNSIVAFNKIMNWGGNVPLGMANTGYANTHGIAVVQNVFEFVTNDATYPAIDLSMDNLAVPNVLFFNNTVVGSRVLWSYNSTGTASFLHVGWSSMNNSLDVIAIKSDTFGTDNGARIGNWAQLYGVISSGNLYAECAGIAGASDFQCNFPGLKTDAIATTGEPPDGTARALAYPAYTDRKAWDGTSTGAGNGDYTLGVTSPGRALQQDWLLPFDIAGTARAATSAAGAYHFGEDDTGNFFFML